MAISIAMVNFKTKQFFADLQYLSYVFSYVISLIEILIWSRNCKPKTQLQSTCTLVISPSARKPSNFTWHVGRIAKFACELACWTVRNANTRTNGVHLLGGTAYEWK